LGAGSTGEAYKPSAGQGSPSRNPSSAQTATDGYLLICGERNDFLARQNGTTGKSVARAKTCQARLMKIFRYACRANQ
jgi:hypothetical protein